MSDITYSERAVALLAEAQRSEEARDEAIRFGAGQIDRSDENAAVAKAGVNASLAVARAAREIDNKLKYVGEMISGTIAACASGQSEEWITWEGEDGTRKAVQVRYVQSFASDGDEAILFVDGVPEPVRVPISYGEIALMVGI